MFSKRSAPDSGTLPPRFEPVPSADRIEVLDVLRAAALLLIFLFNVHVFSGYIFLSPERAQALWSYPLDRAAYFLRLVFVENKDFSIFAFLFGIGFGMQMVRAREHGTAFLPRYARRLLILLLIGLADSFLLWGGDILLPYALLGFLLIPFRHLSDRGLLIGAVVVYLLTIPLYGFMWFVGMPEPYSVASGLVGDPALAMTWIHAFSDGNYLDVIGGNAAFMAFWWAMFVINLYWPDVLGLFLLGLYVGRRQVLREIADHPSLLRWKVIIGCGLVGLVGNGVFALLTEKGVYYPPSFLGLVQVVVQAISVPSLCFFYAAGLAMLLRRASWRRWLSPLAALGRMTLTNYLLQSILCMFIFYGIGLGLFRKVGAATAMGIALVVFGFQVAISRWWLTRFHYGPVEWIWRRLTYGTKLPLGRAAAPGESG